MRAVKEVANCYQLPTIALVVPFDRHRFEFHSGHKLKHISHVLHNPFCQQIPLEQLFHYKAEIKEIYPQIKHVLIIYFSIIEWNMKLTY